MSKADQPIRWGVLGAARITSKVAPAMKEARGSQLEAIAARDINRAQEWAKTYGAPIVHASYEALLDDPNVDAVYIPLPPHLHHEWTIKAAEKGKHVLCEKPLALSSTEVQEMWAACREHNVQFMDGVMWHHHPRTKAMLDYIHSGKLGVPRRMTSAFTFCWPQVPELDKEPRLHRDMGGGSLYDLGWYTVGATILAFKGLPERVYATARWHNDVDMNLSAIMWYSDNRMASFDCGFDTTFREWMEVSGTESTLVCDDFVQPNPLVDSHRFWTHKNEGAAETHKFEKTNHIVHMIENFCDDIRSGKLNTARPQLSLEVQYLCDLILESARKEQPLKVEPLPKMKQQTLVHT